jgi:hypothetical protein
VAVQLSDHPIDGPCLSGVSDDGDGTFLLGFVNGRFGPPRNEYDFFRTDGGSAARLGDKSVVGGDDAPVQIFSQPSGFTSFQVSGDTGGRTLSTWSHDGEFVSSTKITPDDFSSNNFAAAGIDPSGGTAIVKTIHSNDGTAITTYQRFDKAGVAETGEVPIDSGATAVGVALSGHALIVGPQARWVARDGTPISGPFTVQDNVNRFQFLLDGSLALGSAAGFSSPPESFVSRIEDGATVAGPLPDWLAARASNRLYAVRSGKAYATWGSGGACGGDLEILAPSGKSCGCVKVPDLSASASVGRDGSLIVPRPDTAPGCSYDLYPKLLR